MFLATITNAPTVVFSLDWAIVVQLVLAVFLPILVGLVTTKVTAGNIKAWLLAGLTLITSLLTQVGHAIATSAPFDIGLALLTVIPAFAISVATYYGLWKPTGVSIKAQQVESTTIVDRNSY